MTVFINMQIPVNHLWLHWKKSQKDFTGNFTTLTERIHTVAIHDIRVAIKKLRAFLRLYQLLKKEPEWDYQFRKTEQLFDVLGRYRDIEICLDLVRATEKETAGDYREFRNYLRLLLKITRAWANQAIHRYHKKELAKIAFLLKQDEQLAFEDEFIPRLEALLDEQLASAKKHFRQPHRLRKDLKEVYYWIAVFPETKPVRDWHPKELHSILDDLGNWQDLEILTQRVRHFRKDWLPKLLEEYALLKELQSRIKDRKKQLLADARRKTRSWLKKVAGNDH